MAKKRKSSAQPKSKGKGPQRARLASSSGTSQWITCVKYELKVATDSEFQFDFVAHDASGNRYVLQVEDEDDEPQLVQDLYDALAIWPSGAIEIQADKVAGTNYFQIKSIKRLHPR